MNKLLVLAIALGSFAACAPPVTTINITPGDGGSNDGGSGGAGAAGTTSSTTAQGGSVDDSAHGYYVATVHPSLIGTCGGCHNPDGQVGAPAFLDYDAELSYPMSKGYPNIVKDPASDSSLIKKGPHDGPGVSADQKTMIQTWISKELSEGNQGSGGSGGAGGSTSTGPATLEDMLTGFAACMDYDIWLSSGMDKFPLQQTNGDGPCMSCHNTGVGATYLSGDPQDTFDNNKLFPFIMRLVTPVYEGSTPVDLAASSRFFNKGKEPCQNPPICHPKFDLTPENKAALENFVSVTLTKWQSGACGKP